jgi:hypothetical protein
MKIYEDFDLLEPEDIKNLLKKIKDVCTWTSSSIYRSCFEDVYVVLHDTPINEYAYVDIDPYTKKVYVSINLYSLIDEFYHNDFFKFLIFKTSDITLETYILFFLLHELGHIVHCQLVIPGKNSLYEKFQFHYFRYHYYLEHLDKKYEKYNYDDISEIIQKKYRKIPSEKVADDFAFRHLYLFI